MYYSVGMHESIAHAEKPKNLDENSLHQWNQSGGLDR